MHGGVYTIFSDLKSLREASHPLVSSINKINMRLIKRGIKTFCWVPAHGYCGNKQADKSARETTEESSGEIQVDYLTPTKMPFL